MRLFIAVVKLLALIAVLNIIPTFIIMFIWNKIIVSLTGFNHIYFIYTYIFMWAWWLVNVLKSGEDSGAIKYVVNRM